MTLARYTLLKMKTEFIIITLKEVHGTLLLALGTIEKNMLEKMGINDEQFEIVKNLINIKEV